MSAINRKAATPPKPHKSPMEPCKVCIDWPHCWAHQACAKNQNTMKPDEQETKAAIFEDATKLTDGAPAMLAAIQRHARIRAAGFAGCNREGMLVDRRDFPDALPCLRNPSLHIPHPTRCGECGSQKLAWDGESRTATRCTRCGDVAPSPNPDQP